MPIAKRYEHRTETDKPVRTPSLATYNRFLKQMRSPDEEVAAKLPSPLPRFCDVSCELEGPQENSSDEEDFHFHDDEFIYHDGALGLADWFKLNCKVLLYLYIEHPFFVFAQESNPFPHRPHFYFLPRFGNTDGSPDHYCPDRFGCRS